MKVYARSALKFTKTKNNQKIIPGMPVLNTP